MSLAPRHSPVPVLVHALPSVILVHVDSMPMFELLPTAYYLFISAAFAFNSSLPFASGKSV